LFFLEKRTAKRMKKETAKRKCKKGVEKYLQKIRKYM
jgi:hypothetical protein